MTRAEIHRERRAKHTAEARLNPGKGMNRQFRRMFTRLARATKRRVKVTQDGILKVVDSKKKKKV